MNDAMISTAISRLLTRGNTEDFAYGLIFLKTSRKKDLDLPSWMGVTFDSRGRPWLYWNPDFSGAPQEGEEGLNLVMGVLRHEAHHLFLLHPIRKAKALKEFSSAVNVVALTYAMEHTANEGILEHIPDGIYYPELRGYTTQEVYDELLKRAEQIKCEQNKGAGLPSDDGTSSSGLPSGQQEGAGTKKSLLDQHAQELAELDKLEEALQGLNGADIIPAEGGADAVDRAKQIIIRTLQSAKSRGTLPGHLDNVLQELTDKRLPLAQAFRKMLQRLAFQSRSKWNYTRTRISRRYPAYPGRIKTIGEGLGLVLDSSGSMADKELSILMAEVDRAARKYGVYLIGADAQVYGHRRYRPGDWRKFKLARGGTNFQPAVDLAVEMGMKKLIYLTDMLAPPPDPKGIDILWVCTKKETHYYNHQSFPGEIFYVGDYITDR